MELQRRARVLGAAGNRAAALRARHRPSALGEAAEARLRLGAARALKGAEWTLLRLSFFQTRMDGSLGAVAGGTAAEK